VLKGRLATLTRLGTLGLAAYIGWTAWRSLGPHKPQIGPIRRAFADRVIPDIVEDLRQSRGDIRQAALLHFENDPTDYFTNRLRTEIEQSGILDLRDRTIGEKLADLLNLRHTAYGSLAAALERGRKLGAQGVVFGTIHSFETRGGKAAIDVEVHLADVSSGGHVFSRRYQEQAGPATMVAANIEQAAKRFPWFQRLLGWLIAVLLLPVFTIAFIRAMVRRGSNKINAFVLAIYTAVDALLAFLLVGAYNIRIMSFAARLEEE